MATILKSKKTGKKIVLLDPNEKVKRYARQMKAGKVKETGKKLSKTDYAFRAGYIECQRDNAKAYCHRVGIVSKAKLNDVAKRKRSIKKLNKRGK